MKKPLLVFTGCSHTAGNEQINHLFIPEYKNFCEMSKKFNQRALDEEVFKFQVQYLLQQSHRKKYYNELMANNKNNFIKLVQRYIAFKEKQVAWPKIFEDKFEIINLAVSGGSFKYQIKLLTTLIDSIPGPMTVIHQVPQLIRTYVKLNGKIHHLNPNYFRNTKDGLTKILESKYKAFVLRENYFQKAREKHIKILKKINRQDIKNYFITEDLDDYQNFKNETVIIKEFRKFRNRYLKSPIGGHVIDKNFAKDMSATIMPYITNNLPC